MGWNQAIDYVDVEVTLPPPVKKQIWDGKKFVPVTFYRRTGSLSDEKKQWLFDNFGARGPRWDYSLTGNFWIMDEQIYVWYQMKWGDK